MQTVYKSFGGKPGLLKAAYDVALAGDVDEVAIRDRPEAQAVAQARDAVTAATAYAALVATLSSRAGPLARVIATSRGIHADVEALAEAIAAERLLGTTLVAEHWAARRWLRPGLSVDAARDQLWTLNSPAVFDLLTERHWSVAQYRDWIRSALLALVLQP